MSRRTRLHLVSLDERCVPSGIPSTWSVRGSGGGGALFSPSINPANPGEYSIASDMSQVFRSTNAGVNWSIQDFRELQGGHAARVHFTDNPNIRYALDYTGDVITPTKSTDGGSTWTPFTNDPTDSGAYYLYADPNNSNRLVVTSYDTLYYSGDGGASWNARHTTSDGAGIFLGGAFWDGNTVYLGTNLGLFVSTDNGASFAIQALGGIPGDQRIVSFAGGKSGGVTRFVAVTNNVNDVYSGMAPYENSGDGKALTLTLGDANWAVETLPAGTTPFFAAMAANDTTNLFVAGGGAAGKPTVVKSPDGGTTWYDVLITANNKNVQTGWSGHGGDRDWTYGEIALGFTINNADSQQMILTDYGYAHSSTDGGATWKALYVNPADLNSANALTPKFKSYRDSGLDNTTSWQVAWPGSGNVLIANSDVRGQRSTDNGLNFGFNYLGHTRNSMYRIVQSGSTIYAAVASVHDLYQSTYLTDAKINGGNGAVLFSTDSGANWSTLHDFGNVVCWVAADPANPNRLYASVADSVDGGIYVTNNLNAGAASTWTKLAAPPRTEGHAFNVFVLGDGTLVATYSGRRNSSGTFTQSSGVFVSTNGGTSWSDRSAPGLRYWTKDVIIDPHDLTQQTWYAGVFSGWGGPPNGLGGLYKTTDRGVTWTRVLSLDRVTSATFNPFDPDELFVTTETDGLWYSSNIRSTTPTFAPVASYKFRQPERVFFNPSDANEIWVTSFGGGVMVGVNNPLAPTTQVNGGAVQRSRLTGIQVTFSAPVDAATLTGLGAVTLTRTSGAAGFVQTGATGANGRIIVSPPGGMVTSVMLTFDNANGTAASATVESGSLADGRWQLAIPSQSFTSTLNDPGLRRFFGDLDNSGSVDATDFAAFGGGFGATGSNSQVDFDNNGLIDATDLAAFGGRFGFTI